MNNRPNAKVYTGVVVCPAGEQEVTFAISKISGWSGIKSTYGDERWDNQVDKAVTMKCVDLNDICPSKVDYMTVDTEGSELDILKTFDFDSHGVTIIQVERNMKTAKQREEERELTEFMESKGYEKVGQIDIGNWAVDDVFKKRE